MKLVEQGHGFQYPLFHADNIRDLLDSRVGVITALNPTLDAYRQRLLQYYGIDPQQPDDLRTRCPDYRQRFSVQLSSINHDPSFDSESMGMYLFDTTGGIFAKLPKKVTQLMNRILTGEEHEYEFWKNTLWMDRRVRIYAEITGYADTADAYHDFAPSGEGGLRAMLQALCMANVSPQDIDYINAHATSTPVGDPKEMWALNELYKGVDKSSRPLVSSIKSMIGHPLGAAGAIEAIACIMAINTGVVPPTINLENPRDDNFDYVANHAKQKDIRRALNTSFGVGGLNSAVIFERYNHQG